MSELFTGLDERPQHQVTPRWWPERHPSSQRLHALLKEMGELHDRKQKDYGTSQDPFANVRGSLDFGVKPWVGAMIRLNDKVKRLQSHAQGSPLANEGALDSMMDIAVYALIAYVLYEQEHQVIAIQDGSGTVTVPQRGVCREVGVHVGLEK